MRGEVIVFAITENAKAISTLLSSSDAQFILWDTDWLDRHGIYWIGISSCLMTSANSTGGVMGKMVAPQSIVVATTATETYGSEGSILRRVILHSVALTCLVGLFVSLLVYWPVLTRLALR